MFGNSNVRGVPQVFRSVASQTTAQSHAAGLFIVVDCVLVYDVCLSLLRCCVNLNPNHSSCDLQLQLMRTAETRKHSLYLQKICTRCLLYCVPIVCFCCCLLS